MSLVAVFGLVGAFGLGVFIGITLGSVIERERHRHRDWYGNVRGDGE